MYLYRVKSILIIYFPLIYKILKFNEIHTSFSIWYQSSRFLKKNNINFLKSYSAFIADIRKPQKRPAHHSPTAGHHKINHLHHSLLSQSVLAPKLYSQKPANLHSQPQPPRHNKQQPPPQPGCTSLSSQKPPATSCSRQPQICLHAGLHLCHSNLQPPAIQASRAFSRAHFCPAASLAVVRDLSSHQASVVPTQLYIWP